MNSDMTGVRKQGGPKRRQQKDVEDLRKLNVRRFEGESEKWR